ncbi:MAG: hypothetical protein E7652_05055 [Ruminococcaceae bacterium]|nr:hypothetical protein [Oscillospiraceae bacterium]
MKEIVALLLCAGKGSRMNDDSTNKVCMNVNGIPAVKRSILNMKKAGIDRFVCVVGHRAEKVMEALSDIEGISYAYQPKQNGTGNAALMGLLALKNLGYKGAVFIAMGDKLISSDVISRLINEYNSKDIKAAFAVQKKPYNPGGGRIAMKEGKICGIYEMTDSYSLILGSLTDKSEANFRAKLDEIGVNEKKKEKIISYALSQGDALSSKVTLCGEEFTGYDIESMPYVNTATYIVDALEAVNEIEKLGSDNAQGEVYLTDAVNALTEKYGASIIPIENKEDMLTFATQEELKEVSDYFASIEKETEII